MMTSPEPTAVVVRRRTGAAGYTVRRCSPAVVVQPTALELLLLLFVLSVLEEATDDAPVVSVLKVLAPPAELDRISECC